MAKPRFDDAAHAERRVYMQRWYAENRKKIQGWVARYRAEHLEEVREYDRSRGARPRSTAMLARLKTAKAVHLVVARAIGRGDLVRPAQCQQCGGSGFIEAAHTDYALPLEVRWLCRPCHRRWDRAEPKTRTSF